MKNMLQVYLEFDPASDYMAQRKNGVLWLKKAFAKPLIENAGGKILDEGAVYGTWDSDFLSIILTVEVDSDSFQAFSEDYDAFMKAVYGKLSLAEFGAISLTVSDYAEVQRKAEQYRLDNAWD